MVILDIAIVNVALPAIKADLHFSQQSLQWVITAYAIFFGGVLLLGGRLADLLGLLTSYVNWSWIFFINVPVAVVVIAVTPWLLRESRVGAAHRHLDLGGAVSVTGGLMLLVYAMTRATQDGWASASTIGLLAA